MFGHFQASISYLCKHIYILIYIYIYYIYLYIYILIYVCVYLVHKSNVTKILPNIFQLLLIHIMNPLWSFLDFEKMKRDLIQLGYITYHAVKLKLYRDEWYMSGLKSHAQDVLSLCDQYNIRWTTLQLWYHVCFWFSSFFWCTTLQGNIHVFHGERRNTSSQVRRINMRLEYEEPLQKRHLSGKTATRQFVQQLVQPTKKTKTSKLRIIGHFWWQFRWFSSQRDRKPPMTAMYLFRNI